MVAFEAKSLTSSNPNLIVDGEQKTLQDIEGLLIYAGNDALVRSGGWLGTLTFIGSEGHDTLEGGSQSDFDRPGAAGDTVVQGFRIINGAGANDLLTGGTGNDTIDGGAGNDTLSGLSGDDRLTGGAGLNQLQGGAGFDVVNQGILVADAAPSVTLTPTSLTGLAGTDTLSSIEGANLFTFDAWAWTEPAVWTDRPTRRHPTWPCHLPADHGGEHRRRDLRPHARRGHPDGP